MRCCFGPQIGSNWALRLLASSKKVLSRKEKLESAKKAKQALMKAWQLTVAIGLMCSESWA
jgi:hypothetical protein